MSIKYTNEADPIWALPEMPIKIKPTWAIEEKAKKRLKLSCLMANKLPIKMVAAANKINIRYQVLAIGVNTLYNKFTKVNSTAPLEITDKKDVTATGDPSYTSAVHKWKGTAEILNAKPEINNINANNCNGLPFKCAVKIEKVKLPVVPYEKEIHNNKMPDEKADDKINFIAASEDLRLVKSKLAPAASGMVDISRPK